MTAAPARTASAFEQWVAPHWTVMSRLAVRLVGPQESDDVVQDALALAWRTWSRFDPARGSARSWLLALVADQARKAHRWRLRRDRPVPLTVTDSQPPTEPAVDIERALAGLSARQRLAVDLYYYLDLPVADVAAVMGCAEGTAKSTLADARSRLRDLLGDDFR